MTFIEHSLPPSDRDEVAPPEPDVMLGYGFTLASIGDAMLLATSASTAALEAMEARSLSSLKVATDALVEMTARAHALAAHLDQQIAKHLAREPRVRP